MDSWETAPVWSAIHGWHLRPGNSNCWESGFKRAEKDAGADKLLKNEYVDHELKLRKEAVFNYFICLLYFHFRKAIVACL
ncbi:MAG: hypothetical protein K8F91_25545 [Candidatus Obscuribacterales bacterium]|nr:hypothetical protein [Candidatus Obscuribacterales bacterium]